MFAMIIAVFSLNNLSFGRWNNLIGLFIAFTDGIIVTQPKKIHRSGIVEVMPFPAGWTIGQKNWRINCIIEEVGDTDDLQMDIERKLQSNNMW